MKCLITAGPTFEPLDDVRRLTNFSTGRLGTELATYLSSHGHEVTLLRGEQATWTEPVKGSLRTFTTGADLRDQLAQAKGYDAIFHAAAVSDFSFGKIFQRSAAGDLIPVKSGKISSWLENLFAELVPTPKILAQLRQWHPQALVVGWKYEVEGNRESVIAEARRQIQESGTDACVANGPAYGSGFGMVGVEYRHCETKEELFAALEVILPKRAG